MRIFVSYASEQRALADRIAVGLRQTGAQVFFDRDALPAGEGYDAEIRARILGADLFLFLVSPESLEPGTYALTELAWARERWPDPSGHVLPVAVAAPRPGQEIPPYLAAVGVLTPAGNAAAEVLGAVAKLQRRRRRRRLALGAAGLAVAAGVAVALALLPDGPGRARRLCALAAELHFDGSSPAAHPTHPRLVVSSPRGTDSFAFSEAGRASFEVAARGGDSWSVDLLDALGVAFGKASFSGCPSGPTERKVGNGVVLTVRPRAKP